MWHFLSARIYRQLYLLREWRSNRRVQNQMPNILARVFSSTETAWLHRRVSRQINICRMSINLNHLLFPWYAHIELGGSFATRMNMQLGVNVFNIHPYSF